MIRQELQIDAGGTIRLDVPEPYRPSVATVALFKPDGSVLQAAASATIDACNTTIVGTEAAGSTALVLTDNTDCVVGRTYVARNADGQHEWMRVPRVDSGGAIVDLVEETEYAYAASDAFLGNRLTYAVSASLADALYDGCRAYWEYTVNGDDKTVGDLFDVVRAPWPSVVLRPDRFKAIVGEAASDAQQRSEWAGLDFADEIAEATDGVRVDLIKRGLVPSQFLTFRQFERPIAFRALLNMAEDSGHAPPGAELLTYQETRRERYLTALQDAINATRSYDLSDDLGLSDAEKDAKRSATVFQR